MLERFERYKPTLAIQFSFEIENESSIDPYNIDGDSVNDLKSHDSKKSKVM